VENLLPDEIWRRPKMGFTLPFERWMRTTLKSELNEALSNGNGLAKLGLRSESARDIWRTFEEQPRKERWSRPWALYVLKKWCELNRVEL